MAFSIKLWIIEEWLDEILMVGVAKILVFNLHGALRLRLLQGTDACHDSRRDCDNPALSASTRMARLHVTPSNDIQQVG